MANTDSVIFIYGIYLIENQVSIPIDKAIVRIKRRIVHNNQRALRRNVSYLTACLSKRNAFPIPAGIPKINDTTPFSIFLPHHCINCKNLIIFIFLLVFKYVQNILPLSHEYCIRGVNVSNNQKQRADCSLYFT